MVPTHPYIDELMNALSNQVVISCCKLYDAIICHHFPRLDENIVVDGSARPEWLNERTYIYNYRLKLTQEPAYPYVSMHYQSLDPSKIESINLNSVGSVDVSEDWVSKWPLNKKENDDKPRINHWVFQGFPLNC